MVRIAKGLFLVVICAVVTYLRFVGTVAIAQLLFGSRFASSGLTFFHY